MRIESNALLKFGVPAVILVGLVLGLRACHNAGDDRAPTGAADDLGNEAPRPLTEDERNALGVEADTPRDTVATLVGQMHQMRAQLEDSQQESAKLRAQNKRLADQKRNMQGAIDQAFTKQRAQDRRRRESLVDSLNRKIASLRVTLGATDSNARPGDAALPVGLGLNASPAGARAGLTWVDPLGASAARSDAAGERSGNGAPAFATAFDSGGEAVQAAAGRSGQAPPGNGVPAAVPVYTVPKNATLVGSVAMSALLGRVPVNGAVQDPYPFKVVIGPDNLTANGIELPELKGAIVSGTATGDWTLSCVRGTVYSITFVFQDGAIRTVPPSAKPGKANTNKNNNKNEIGYLSNPQGVPCVSGTRKTNARSFILTSLLLSAGAGAANAVAGGQTTTGVSGFGATQGVTGNIGKYIAGRAASKGLSEVRQWVEKRFGQTFDAVYVPPGQPVAVNVDKTLPIDYESQGRKVHHVGYENAQRLD